MQAYEDDPDEGWNQSLEEDFLESLRSLFAGEGSTSTMADDDEERRPAAHMPSVKIDFKEKDRLQSGVNYDVWAMRVRGFLREARLWGYIDGSNPRPVVVIEGVLEQAHKDWDTFDERAQGVIRSALSESMVLSVTSATTTKEMWDHLSMVPGQGHDVSNGCKHKILFVEDEGRGTY